MLRSRIIPCLLVHNKGLVKSVKFKDLKYVGDPINAVRIFNEKEVDELIVLDIDATVKKIEPDYAMIANLAAECRMPLCYGGGVKTVDQVVRIVKLGVEKVSISSAAVENPEQVSMMTRQVGSQSIVATLDIRKESHSKAYRVWTHNGKNSTRIDPVDFAKQLESVGVGEITINSIDHDGTMSGYDLDLVRRIRNAITLPITVLGGAGSHEDIVSLVKQFGIIGAGAGSLFVFKGKYRAVLINYPSREEKKLILRRAVEDETNSSVLSKR